MSQVTTTENVSYWKQTANGAAYEPLREERSVEVAVVGGGIVGLTTALLLKRAGIRVAVLEARALGVGTTGYSTAKLTSLHKLVYADLEREIGESGTRMYAEANEWGISAIGALVEELRIDCRFERRPALTFTTDPDRTDEFEGEVEAARRAGLPVTAVVDSDLPFPIAAGILLEDQASFHPLRYCLALAREVHGDGSVIYEGTRVVDVEDENPLQLRTDTGAAIRAAQVVLACGMPFLDRSGFFARMQPTRSYCMAMRGATSVPESMSINVEEPTLSIRPLPTDDGERLLLLGGAGHHVGRSSDGTEGNYRILEDFGRRRFGAEEVVARWSAQDYVTLDRTPMVGRMPFGPESILVATGFAKWGLAMGTAAARILCDQILDEVSPWAQPFDASRSQLPDKLGKVIKEGMGDAKRFVGDRLRQGSAPEVDELAPSTGAICRHDGKAVAAFRDTDGRLHLLSPTCTHLGCRVVWNESEHSWDCPCHGSRFSVLGEILNGPAVRPLERIEPEG